MKIDIYTTTTCPFCTKAKKLLTKRGYTYIEHLLDDETDREQFKRDNPTLKTVPQIFVTIDDKTYHIGGFTELVNEFEMEKNILKSVEQ